MSRSMMLKELQTLQAVAPEHAELADYKRLILDENVLGKPTESSRIKSLRHLTELYGLDPSLFLFRNMRKLGNDSPEDLPLLAMLCCFCRDPQLRHSFDLIRNLAVGDLLTRQQMEEHLEEGYPGRFSKRMKESLARNVNTSWTASGHLEGQVKKFRSRPSPSWAASTYAMLLGYLLDLRGEILLSSVFADLVAATPQTLIAHLTTASSRDWLRLRHAGGVVDIDFSEIAGQ